MYCFKARDKARGMQLPPIAIQTADTIIPRVVSVIVSTACRRLAQRDAVQKTLNGIVRIAPHLIRLASDFQQPLLTWYLKLALPPHDW